MMYCVADYRAQVHKKLPKLVSSYVSEGSWQQQTLAANEADFERVFIEQRVARNIAEVDIATRILGYAASAPMVISPTGMNGLIHPDGEIAMVKAATHEQIPYCSSIASSYSIESLAQAANNNLWLQVSLIKDADFLQALLERAQAAGIKHLVLTIDFHLSGNRFSDARNGLVLPLSWRRFNYLNLLSKPLWWRRYLGSNRPPVFGNIIGHAKGVRTMDDFIPWYKDQFDLALSWEKVRMLRQKWPGMFIVKGVLHAHDIKAAFDSGADAVSLSNHGGRQLDGAPSTISRLAALENELSTCGPVFLDGGVRTGQDVYKALSLGAASVLLGRAPLYGLGLRGEEGVRHVLTLLKNELKMSLALSGVRQAGSLTRDQVVFPKEWRTNN